MFLSYFRVDSIMLLEEGFNMTSVDLSDKMLKYALKTRWKRRKEPAFDNWGKYYAKICVLVVENCYMPLVDTIIVQELLFANVHGCMTIDQNHHPKSKVGSHNCQGKEVK